MRAALASKVRIYTVADKVLTSPSGNVGVVNYTNVDLLHVHIKQATGRQRHRGPDIRGDHALCQRPGLEGVTLSGLLGVVGDGIEHRSRPEKASQAEYAGSIPVIGSARGASCGAPR